VGLHYEPPSTVTPAISEVDMAGVTYMRETQPLLFYAVPRTVAHADMSGETSGAQLNVPTAACR